MNKVPVKDMRTQAEDTTSLLVAEELAKLYTALTGEVNIKLAQDWIFPLVWREYLRRQTRRPS